MLMGNQDYQRGNYFMQELKGQIENLKARVSSALVRL